MPKRSAGLLIKSATMTHRLWRQLRLALIKRRVELGLSQQTLANQMGITQPAVSQFERLGGNPRIMTILNYAHALGVRVDLGAKPKRQTSL